VILIADNPEPVCAWVAAKISDKIAFKDCNAIGVIDEKRGLIGGVVFHDYKPNHGSIQISIAFEPGGITRRLLKAVFWYVFDGLKLRRAYSCISVHNTKSLDICERIGFVREGIMRQTGLDGEDMIMLSMLREENKWK
jgi:RimJ/RimL family protein N-acetyltransferase